MSGARAQAAMSSIACPRLALALGLLLAACRPAETEAPPLRVDAIGAEAEAVVAESLAGTLTAIDPAGQMIPGLAQSWRVSSDGLSIVFRLREARYAGGRAVTAADVIASVERARQGRAGADIARLMAGVTAVAAPLDDTVELRLSTPQPEILELLSLPALAIRPRRGGSDTAGPFTLADPDDEPATRAEAPALPAGAVRLRRNPAFHAADLMSLAAAIVAPAEAEAAVARFNRGETDLVLGGGLDGLGAARVTARRESLLLEARRSVLLVRVNQTRGALADRRVRRALMLAINREALGPALFASTAAAPIATLTPPGLGAYDPPRADWATLALADRQAEARRLLAEARAEPAAAPAAPRPMAADAPEADTPPLRLVLAVPAAAASGRLVTAIAADLMAVGVELALAPRPADAHARAIETGDFELALDRIDAPIDSPLPFLLPFRCRANRHGVCLEEADRLVEQSWQAPTRAERLALLAAAERLWAEDGAALGLVQPLGWSLVSPRVGGMAANASGRHPLKNLTLTPDRRSRP